MPSRGSQAAFSRPLGITTDGSGNVYVTDGYSTIRKITPGSTVTTLAGTAGVRGTVDGLGLAAQFTRADSVAADRAGNIYVGDYGAIRKVTPSGQVTTLAGRMARARKPASPSRPTSPLTPEAICTWRTAPVCAKLLPMAR